MTRTLMWREWRNQRALVLIVTGFSLVACKLLSGVESLTYDGQWAVRIVLPFLTAAFVGITGTDTFVCPERNGRAHMSMLLPVSTKRVWFAKAAYLALATIGFIVVLTLYNARLVTGVDSLHSSLSTNTLLIMAMDTGGHLMMLCVFLFGGSVLFFSSLLQRRSVAMWCSAASFAWLVYLAVAFEGRDLSATPLAPRIGLT